jgi:hypothetical protein
MAAIGGPVLKHVLQNSVTYLKMVVSTWQSILAAPVEVKEVGRQAEALCICVESLLEQVQMSNSIISATATKEGAAIEKFLGDCTGKLDVLMELQEKYSTKLKDGRRTWTAAFQRSFDTLTWIVGQRGKAEDLTMSIKNDVQVVTSITLAEQT